MAELEIRTLKALRSRRVDALRTRNEPTVPASMVEELATNPFLRDDQPVLQAVMGAWVILSRPSPRFAAARTCSDSGDASPPSSKPYPDIKRRPSS